MLAKLEPQVKSEEMEKLTNQVIAFHQRWAAKNPIAQRPPPPAAVAAPAAAVAAPAATAAPTNAASTIYELEAILSDPEPVKFGWTNFEYGPPLPFIYRGSRRFVANRINFVTLCALAFKDFSNKIFEFITVPLFKMTCEEADVFNDINVNHCDRTLVGDHLFAVNDPMTSIDDVKCLVGFLKAARNAVFKREFNNDLFGFLRIGDNKEVPFIWNNGQKQVPLFYFEGTNEFLDSKSELLVDMWKLVYLKFCCFVQGIRRDHYIHGGLRVVNFEYVEQLCSSNMSFSLCWPQEINEELFSPEERVARLFNANSAVNGSLNYPTTNVSINVPSEESFSCAAPGLTKECPMYIAPQAVLATNNEVPINACLNPCRENNLGHMSMPINAPLHRQNVVPQVPRTVVPSTAPSNVDYRRAQTVWPLNGTVSNPAIIPSVNTPHKFNQKKAVSTTPARRRKVKNVPDYLQTKVPRKSPQTASTPYQQRFPSPVTPVNIHQPAASSKKPKATKPYTESFETNVPHRSPQTASSPDLRLPSPGLPCSSPQTLQHNTTMACQNAMQPSTSRYNSFDNMELLRGKLKVFLWRLKQNENVSAVVNNINNLIFTFMMENNMSITTHEYQMLVFEMQKLLRESSSTSSVMRQNYGAQENVPIANWTSRIKVPAHLDFGTPGYSIQKCPLNWTTVYGISLSPVINNEFLVNLRECHKKYPDLAMYPDKFTPQNFQNIYHLNSFQAALWTGLNVECMGRWADIFVLYSELLRKLEG